VTPKEAARLLAGAELITLLEGSMAYAKELRDHFLAAEVPVLLGQCAGTS